MLLRWSVRLHAAAFVVLAAPCWAGEPADIGSPHLRLSTTLAVPPVAQAASSAPTFTERMQQPAEVLAAERQARERELLQVVESAARQQRTIGELEQRLAQARAQRHMNPLVVGLVLLLAALAAATAVSWWKLRRRQPMAGQAPPAT